MINTESLPSYTSSNRPDPGLDGDIAAQAEGPFLNSSFKGSPVSLFLIERVLDVMPTGDPYPDLQHLEIDERKLLGWGWDPTPNTRLRGAHETILRAAGSIALEKPQDQSIVETREVTKSRLKKPFSVNKKAYTYDWLIKQSALMDALEAAMRIQNDPVIQVYDAIAHLYGNLEKGGISKGDLLQLKEDLLLSCKQAVIMRVLSDARLDFRANWAKLDPTP